MFTCPNCNAQLSSLKSLNTHMKKPPAKCQMAMFKRDRVNISDDEDDDDDHGSYNNSRTKHFNSEIKIIDPDRVMYERYFQEGLCAYIPLIGRCRLIKLFSQFREKTIVCKP